ncbi:MAG: filamentous hemagglutinin N-terminal domain-containing protein, partial [Betaproteobacteria bacterium]|nr:filamentous hemagglutinin N-terminal domain-containing protein [Betaproteobacteria bacterium]
MRKHTALFTPHHVALAVACLCMGLARAQTAPAPTQLPSGGKVVGGNASISASGSTLNINQSSNRAAIDWNSFNVGSDARVNFNQPSASSVTLNRVVGGDPSQIMGRINAPGQVFISNASGVIFGAKSQVDVGGLLVTTLGISNDDFMAGKSNFSGNGSQASVVNQGTLQAALGGFVALLAPEVRNEGIIVAHQGTVAMASGNKATLVFSGTSLTTVEVEQGIINALVENKHMLMADGGLVLMTARSASALMGSLVKNSGTVQAQTIANRNGRILLMGDMTSGTTQVEGKLDASAPNGGDGGFIETSAARVNIGPQATVTTQSAKGKYGEWLVDPVDFTVADSGGDMTGTTLQNNLGTSNVTLMSAAGATNGLGDVNINSSINWSANTTLTLTASNNVNINANMMATGNSAGLVIKPSTTHTSGGVTQTANSSGVFNVLFGKYIKLTGTAPSLSIGGQSYTVINSLGTATSSGDGSLQGMRGNL